MEKSQSTVISVHSRTLLWDQLFLYSFTVVERLSYLKGKIVLPLSYKVHRVCTLGLCTTVAKYQTMAKH